MLVWARTTAGSPAEKGVPITRIVMWLHLWIHIIPQNFTFRLNNMFADVQRLLRSPGHWARSTTRGSTHSGWILTHVNSMRCKQITDACWWLRSFLHMKYLEASKAGSSIYSNLTRSEVSVCHHIYLRTNLFALHLCVMYTCFYIRRTSVQQKGWRRRRQVR